MDAPPPESELHVQASEEVEDGEIVLRIRDGQGQPLAARVQLRRSAFPDALGPWTFRKDPENRGVEEQWYRDRETAEAWQPIEVPARWSQTHVGGYLGYGWYRTSLRVPEHLRGETVYLLFGGVDEQAWIYLNGQLVREHTTASMDLSVSDLWNRPFLAEIEPDMLDHEGENELVVRVHASAAEAGLWRPVLLRDTRDDQADAHLQEDYMDLVGRGLDRDKRFWVDDTLRAALAPGAYELHVRVGYDHEYVPLSADLVLEAGQGYEIEAVLPQWFDPNERGWFSTDLHTHSYRYGDLDVRTDADYPRGVDYGLVALAGRSAGLDLTVDNLSHHVTMDKARTREIERRYSTPEALLMLSQEVKLGPGHVNVPGAHPGLLERTDPQHPFQIADLRDQVRAEGGALVYTHPMRIPWFTRMTALEAFAHVVKEEPAALWDIGPASSSAARVQLFGLWNLGTRIGVAATTDWGLHQLIGTRRTYIKAERLEREPLLAGLRQRRTIASIGPIFVDMTVGEAGPGAVVEPGTYELAFDTHALRGVETVEVVVDGKVVETFEGQRRIRFSERAHVELEAGSYATVHARGGGRSVATPVFAEGAPRDDKYATLMYLNDLDRHGARTKAYFLNLIATVNANDVIERITILRDGRTLHTISAAERQFPPDVAWFPILRGDWPDAHEKSWRFWPADDEARHVLLTWPVEGEGAYQIKVHTRQGRTVDAGTIDFEDDGDSWQGGLIQLFGEAGFSRYTTWAHSDVPEMGERIPATSQWEAYGTIETLGPGGERLYWESPGIEDYDHPAQVRGGAID